MGLDDFRFSTDVRVRFAETDAQGVAHNAEFLVWYEVGRIDYLSRFRGGYRGLQEEGYEALTIESYVRYRAPAYFDDVLRVHLRCSGIKGARFRYDYAIERLADGTIVADGWTKHAVVDRATYRPTRFPAWLAEEIASAER